MSLQDQALKEKKSPSYEILNVIVQGTPGDPGIVPETIVLKDKTYTVLWICNGLPRGARLQIHFLEDLRGPFVDLVHARSKVGGCGNRGPRSTVEEYEYEARIVRNDGTSWSAGRGRVINQATKKVPCPRGSIDPIYEPPKLG